MTIVEAAIDLRYADAGAMLETVRHVYLLGVAIGFAIAGFGLIHVRVRTGEQPLTVLSRPQPAELLRVSAVLAHVALYVLGTYRPDVWLFRPVLGPWPATIAAGAVLLYSGLGIYLTCVLTLGRSFRIGGDPGSSTRLVTHGIYARVRHPIYTAMFVEVAGATLMFPCALTLAALPVAAVGMHAQALREERWWLENFHEEYSRYAERTGRFVPR